MADNGLVISQQICVEHLIYRHLAPVTMIQAYDGIVAAALVIACPTVITVCLFMRCLRNGAKHAGSEYEDIEANPTSSDLRRRPVSLKLENIFLIPYNLLDISANGNPNASPPMQLQHTETKPGNDANTNLSEYFDECQCHCHDFQFGEKQNDRRFPENMVCEVRNKAHELQSEVNYIFEGCVGDITCLNFNDEAQKLEDNNGLNCSLEKTDSSSSNKVNPGNQNEQDKSESQILHAVRSQTEIQGQEEMTDPSSTIEDTMKTGSGKHKNSIDLNSNQAPMTDKKCFLSKAEDIDKVLNNDKKSDCKLDVAFNFKGLQLSHAIDDSWKRIVRNELRDPFLAKYLCSPPTIVGSVLKHNRCKGPATKRRKRRISVRKGDNKGPSLKKEIKTRENVHNMPSTRNNKNFDGEINGDRTHIKRNGMSKNNRSRRKRRGTCETGSNSIVNNELYDEAIVKKIFTRNKQLRYLLEKLIQQSKPGIRQSHMRKRTDRIARSDVKRRVNRFPSSSSLTTVDI